MKISTKGRYGLRAMVDLAVNSKGEHVALYSIAGRQDVSENYLEQVFSVLRKAGLVKSVKGAQGRYTLANSPSEVTVGQILRALEGDLSITDEATSDQIGPQNVEKVLQSAVWSKMNQSINQVVDSITLADIVEQYKQLTGSLSIMYYI